MLKVVNKERILKHNPHIDKKMLNESIMLSELLIDNGAKMATYNLASPFAKRRIRKIDGDFTCTKGSRLPRRT